MFAPPVMSDFESQKRSVRFPLITVGGCCDPTAMLDWLTTIKPPWWLPVMLEPSRSACELLVTKIPWPWLFETTRLAPAFKKPPPETSTPPVFPPQVWPGLVMRSLALFKLRDEPVLTATP